MHDKRFTIDTNILVYALDRQAKEKHQISARIIQKAIQFDCFLTLQSLSEFYASTTRKQLLDPKIANEQINDWSILFPIVPEKYSTLTNAIRLTRKHSLSFWDAMLLATAQEANAKSLISEDFNHNQSIEGIKIINPFTVSDVDKIDIFDST